MIKKGLLILVTAALVATGAFAQKNTVTVDFMPMIMGLSFGGVSNFIDEEGLDTHGFGIAAQYERNLFPKFSVIGRFSYFGAGIDMTLKEGGISAGIGINLTSISFEAHARFYPRARAFFLDGMFGYGFIKPSFSGHLIVEENGIYKKEAADFSIKRNYIKFGAKLGWRIDFGKPGGFIFEPSFGWYGAKGLGSSFGGSIAKELDIDDYDSDDINEMFSLLERFGFMGGPRMSLAFGWRF